MLTRVYFELDDGSTREFVLHALEVGVPNSDRKMGILFTSGGAVVNFDATGRTVTPGTKVTNLRLCVEQAAPVKISGRSIWERLRDPR